MMLVAALLSLSPAIDDGSEAVRAALSKCGIAPARIAVEWSDMLQDHLVEITASDAADATLACVAELPLLVTFRDAALDRRYRPIKAVAQRRQGREFAESWLRDHNKLNGVPGFDAGETAEGFARAAERHCGVAPGSLLHLDGTFVTPAVRTDPGNGDALFCVLSVFALSDAEERGVRLGFVGNETLAVPE